MYLIPSNTYKTMLTKNRNKNKGRNVTKVNELPSQPASTFEILSFMKPELFKIQADSVSLEILKLILKVNMNLYHD